MRAHHRKHTFAALFCCFMIYYTIEEAIEIFKWRFAYFTEFWNVLDVLLLGVSAHILLGAHTRAHSVGLHVHRLLGISTDCD
jgi:hypothetical protein